ncbi:MAG: DUF4276 family protein [Muribaculaceae bacterium]|nr:DUF4276 family protein [Muribaculaceae bacterium]
MVTLSLIVEGGVYPENVDATTASNVEALRQSLHSFFSRILKREDVSIKLFMGHGYRNAAKSFITSDSPIALFVDSDLPAGNIYKWFDKLVNIQHPEMSIIIPRDRMQYVFFMIQEMEAWFLKQPECMEKWAETEGYTRMDKNMAICDHSVIKGKEIEEIGKPSQKMAILMKKFFKKGKKGASYGKLRTSPGLLDAIDTDALIAKDKELQRFKRIAENL